jgi:hypothetical protein
MRTAAAVAVSSSPIVTFGALQLLGSSQVPRWPAVADEFADPRFWLTIVIMLLAGAFGGVAYELLLRKGAIELPHRVRLDMGGRTYSHAPHECLIALGTLGRGFVGAAAAMTVLLVVAPSNAHAAIALGVTSGAAAPAVIRLMGKQLLFAADALARLRERSRASASETEEAPAPPRRRRRMATEPATSGA